MKNLRNNLLALLTIGLMTIACTSPQDLLESGNYDDAVQLAVKKLAGKKKKKAKYVQALEAAFAKATEQDLRAAERFKRSGRPENWGRINSIYQKIQQRQARVEPLLPLIDQHGLQANFRFVRVDELEKESREKAAAYHYDYAQKLLAEARIGDKFAARRAYKELDKIGRYYSNYKDKLQLKRVARELGTTHILFEMKNQAAVILPYDFEREIKRFGVGDLNRNWKSYHLRKQPGFEYDYQVTMHLTNVAVTPGIVKEREYEDVKEIEDGFDYVLDENGNVMKDTLGNDIKVPRKVFIRARVFETFQNKSAAVSARLDFYDLKANVLLDSKRLAAEAIFENYASTYRGDKRALSEDTKKRIGNQPLPFPADGTLLFDAATQLKPLIKDKISRTRILI